MLIDCLLFLPFLFCFVLQHKASQEGRGEILLENSFMRWRCYQGKIMHTTSKNFSVLYVLRKHQQHINIQWHHLRCYFWLIDHPILGQVATPRSFQLESILECPALDVRQLVRNKRRKEIWFTYNLISQKKIGPFNTSVSYWRLSASREHYNCWYFTRLANTMSS